MENLRSKRVLSALLSTALFLVTGCATTSSNKLSKTEQAFLLIQAADGAIAENDPSGALKFLADAEKLDDSIPELYLSRAIAYANKKMLSQAIQSVKRAVEIRPDYSEANNSLGRYLMDNNQLEEAEYYLIRAASDPLYPDTYKPLTNLGILHYRKGNLEQSERYLTRAIETQSPFACIASYYRGHIRMKKNDLKNAIKDYEASTKKFCGGFGEAHLALGIALERNKEFERARKKFLDVQQRYSGSHLAEQATKHLLSLP
jgi:Tfp pilus assembly protein PilF